MTGHLHIVFAPLLPLPALETLAALAAALGVYALARGARGGFLRLALFASILLALANPSLIEEQRSPLKDTALLVIDDSASMGIGDRARQTAAAAEAIGKKLAGFADLDVETLHVRGTEETDLFHALQQKLAGMPRDRLAGIIALTDGEAHDAPEGPLPAPFHALIAGHHDEIDRRIIVKEAPAYGIVGKSVTLTLRVEDEPKDQSATAPVTFRRDDGAGETTAMPVGKDIPFTVPVGHPGQNLFVFSTPPLPGELTAINNMAAASINGIRDRLRVLLVSGQPHIGGRTWRNFLKADPAVDLVHFTILRSPTKMDATPNSELSLIAFPVHELFATKLKSFDLVIFDRFREQSLVPDEYLANIATYVENGGALLISNATDQNVPPLALSPLARILPTQPTGKILTGAFVPALTATGARHPVTDALTADMPRSQWGPWFRQIEARASRGDVLMTGIDNQPLLVLDHAGQGRVAQFLSDQFWLWSRGYKGGGPQAELLRRTAHWLVGEPELDEAALRAHAETIGNGWQLVITKQSLLDNSAEVAVTDPDGQTSQVTLAAGQEPGVLTATLPVAKAGLYRVKDRDQEILALAGPVDAPEFGDMRATEEKLAPAARASGGGIFWLQDYPSGPAIRRINAGGDPHGWNWIGLKKNGRYRVTGSKAYPLLPPLAVIVALLALATLAWRREGQG